jgi:hypothetical protein
LVNLKSVYEGGLDLRNKDNRFKPMLNNWGDGFSG